MEIYVKIFWMILKLGAIFLGGAVISIALRSIFLRHGLFVLDMVPLVFKLYKNGRRIFQPVTFILDWAWLALFIVAGFYLVPVNLFKVFYTVFSQPFDYLLVRLSLDWCSVIYTVIGIAILKFFFQPDIINVVFENVEIAKKIADMVVGKERSSQIFLMCGCLLITNTLVMSMVTFVASSIIAATDPNFAAVIAIFFGLAGFLFGSIVSNSFFTRFFRQKIYELIWLFEIRFEFSK